MIPDNERCGTLKDLLLEILIDDSVRPCVEAYIKCLEDNGYSFQNKCKESKAKLQVFLAQEPTTETYFGLVIEKSIWDWNSLELDRIK